MYLTTNLLVIKYDLLLSVSTNKLTLTTNFLAVAAKMLTLSRQLRAARALIGWEQTDLASKAEVAIGTIRRMEGSDGPIRGNADTLRRVQGALEAAGVEFLAEDNGGPGVRLKKKGVP